MDNILKEKTKEKYGVTWLDTHVRFYHKKTVEMLLELNIIKYIDKPDGLSFTCELTPWFIHKCNEYSVANNGEKFYWEDLFGEIGKTTNKRISKKLMADMIKLMLFVDDFGKNGEIWYSK